MQNETNHQTISQDISSNELEAIKNEIVTKINDNTRKNIPWNSTIIMVILTVLTIMSVSQMIGSVYVFNKLKSGNFGPSTGVPQTNSLQSAPDMVGGC